MEETHKIDGFAHALAAMGHWIAVQRTHNDVLCCEEVTVAHAPPAPPREINYGTVSISELSLVQAYDPDEVVYVAVESVLRELLGKRLFNDAHRVMTAMRAGPLPCEVVGGVLDGKRFEAGQREPNGWPMGHVVLPLPTPRVPFFPTDTERVSAVTEEVVMLHRDWVSPTGLFWRYLPS